MFVGLLFISPSAFRHRETETINHLLDGLLVSQFIQILPNANQVSDNRGHDRENRGLHRIVLTSERGDANGLNTI